VKDKAKNALEAVRWLQKAFSISERIDDSVVPGIVELKAGACIDLKSRRVQLTSSRHKQKAILVKLGALSHRHLLNRMFLWLIRLCVP
jgi:hypothetical protein